MIFNLTAKWEVVGSIQVDAQNFTEAIQKLSEISTSDIEKVMESGQSNFVEGSIRPCRHEMADDIKTSIVIGLLDTIQEEMYDIESYALLKGLNRKEAVQEILRLVFESKDFDTRKPLKG